MRMNAKAARKLKEDAVAERARILAAGGKRMAAEDRRRVKELDRIVEAADDSLKADKNTRKKGK